MTRSSTSGKRANPAANARRESIPISDVLALLTQAPALICIMRGPEHVFEFANPPYTQLLGNRNLVGRTVREALPELEGQGYYELLDQVYESGEPYVGKESSARIDRDGRGAPEEAFFNFIYQPLYAPGGTIDGILVFAFEVTGLVTSRREAEVLAADLERANREKDDFIAAIAHELRTPLTAILGWTRMVKLGGMDKDTYESALDAIERSTKAQAQLIEDLLDESRIAAGKLRLNMRPLRMSEILEAAIETIAPYAVRHDVRVEPRITPEPAIVFGDPTRLQQVVTNLLSNAIKFTPAGGRVSLELSRQDERVRLAVTDTGRGIRPEFLPYVFDRFRQDENTSGERQSGLGLGLAIVRHLVEFHGGSVAVTSDGPGLGASFTVELPLFTTAESVLSLNDREDEGRNSSFPSLAGVKVLVVEDETDNRDVLAAMLLRCGADVLSVTTAEDALQRVRTWRPDVILSDIRLPTKTGIELLQDIRGLDQGEGGETPAMALSVHGRPADRELALKAGFAVFRQKPIEPADLAFEIARLAGI